MLPLLNLGKSLGNLLFIITLIYTKIITYESFSWISPSWAEA